VVWDQRQTIKTLLFDHQWENQKQLTIGLNWTQLVPDYRQVCVQFDCIVMVVDAKLAPHDHILNLRLTVCVNASTFLSAADVRTCETHPCNVFHRVCLVLWTVVGNRAVTKILCTYVVDWLVLVQWLIGLVPWWTGACWHQSSSLLWTSMENLVHLLETFWLLFLIK